MNLTAFNCRVSLTASAALLAATLAIAPHTAAAEISCAVDSLTDPDADRRVAVVEACGRLGSAAEGFVPELLGALEDRDPSVRMMAAWALGEVRRSGEVVVPALLRATEDPDDSVRFSAVGSLAPYANDVDSVIPSLVTLLKSADHNVAGAAAQTLVEIGPIAVDALKSVLRSPQRDLRIAAAGTLGGIGAGSKTAIPDLIEAAADYDPAVRRTVVDALGRIGADGDWPTGLGFDDELRAHITNRRPLTGSMRASHAKLLHDLNVAKVLPPLIEALGDRESDVRFAAVNGIGRIGPDAAEAMPQLADMMGDMEPNVRRGAVIALGKIRRRPEILVPTLVAAMGDENDRVRTAAKEALRRLPPDTLTIEGATTSSMRTAARVAELQRSRKIATTVPELIEDLGSPDPIVRQRAADALKALGIDQDDR